MSSSSTEQIEKQMVIRELVPGVTTLSVPFSRGGIIKFGGRATIGIYHFLSLAVSPPSSLRDFY